MPPPPRCSWTRKATVQGTSITTCDATHHAGRIVPTDPARSFTRIITKKGEHHGLSYYYEFIARATVTADKLATFLRGVELYAQRLGFAPTTVLYVPFDTPERREFSKRLGGSLTVQHERLCGTAIPAAGQIRDHDLVAGECRVIPKYGVVLIVTDERGRESSFGFFKFPERIVDIHGNIIAEPGVGDRWWFRDFVDSSDPRYRQIVQRFSDAGYTATVKDEFV